MTIRKLIPTLACLLLLAGMATGQERLRSIYASTSDHDKQTIVKKPTDPTYIPAGAKVYVADIDGMPDFENNFVAALQKKRVDLFVISDRSQADFEVNGFARSKDAGWAKIIFGSGLPESEASIQLVNIRTSVVAYAVASYKVNSANGNKSTAEHLAKNLRQKMERDDRRIRQ